MGNKEIDKKLESKNIKPTAMRELVYDVLKKSQKALNLKEIEELFQNVDRSTIFRSLKTFQDNHLVHTVDDGSGTIKYALCDEDCTCSLSDLHVHFLCTRCGRTRCMKDMPVPKITLPTGFSFEGASFVVKGLCPICD